MRATHADTQVAVNEFRKTPEYYPEMYRQARVERILILGDIKYKNSMGITPDSTDTIANETFIKFMSQIPEEVTSPVMSRETYERLNLWINHTQEIANDLIEKQILSAKQTRMVSEYVNSLKIIAGYVTKIYDMNIAREAPPNIAKAEERLITLFPHRPLAT